MNPPSVGLTGYQHADYLNSFPSPNSLDRTNVICEILSANVLENFIRTINPQWINLPNLWTAHSHIWADTGDQLSR